MSLPKDPVMLLSVVNTQLRDNYPSLDEMCEAYAGSEGFTGKEDLVAKLEAINYFYDEALNQFK